MHQSVEAGHIYTWLQVTQPKRWELMCERKSEQAAQCTLSALMLTSTKCHGVTSVRCHHDHRHCDAVTWQWHCLCGLSLVTSNR